MHGIENVCIVLGSGATNAHDVGSAGETTGSAGASVGPKVLVHASADDEVASGLGHAGSVHDGGVALLAGHAGGEVLDAGLGLLTGLEHHGRLAGLEDDVALGVGTHVGGTSGIGALGGL